MDVIVDDWLRYKLFFYKVKAGKIWKNVLREKGIKRWLRMLVIIGWEDFKDGCVLYSSDNHVEKVSSDSPVNFNWLHRCMPVPIHRISDMQMQFNDAVSHTCLWLNRAVDEAQAVRICMYNVWILYARWPLVSISCWPHKYNIDALVELSTLSN